MSTRRTSSRASSTARTQLLTELKDDHKRVKKAYREFKKLDPEQDAEQCEEIVRQVLDELTVHASLEEELLYPAARDAIRDVDMIDEAEVEHEVVHSLIDQLRGMGADDEKFAARFTVLCEYVLHHVKEEEGEMFPQLERARVDWEDLAAEMTERRAELTGIPAERAPAAERQGAKAAATGDSAMAGAAQGEGDSGGPSSRSTTAGRR